MSARIVFLWGAALMTSIAAAANWPQFRGVNASGIDSSAPVPVSWNIKNGKNVAWQTPIPGLAHSAPIIWQDRVYVATAVSPQDEKLKVGLYGDIEPVEDSSRQQWRLLAIDRLSGKVIWNVLGHEAVPRIKRHPKSSHCNPTPATDGHRLVALFGSEGLFSFDMDGNPLWHKDLGPLDSGYYQVRDAQWGFASSPVVRDGKVVVLCDVQTNSFLAAFDLDSGRELWRTPRHDVPTWGTPAIIESGHRSQIVVNGWHHSGGYDFGTGKELWRLNGGGDIPVPTPIFAHDLVYLTSAHGKLRPMRAIRATATGDITPRDPAETNAAIAWVHPRQGNYMQTPIAVGSWVFACTDYGVLSCFDAATGRLAYSERIGNGSEGFTASPVSDARHLFFPSETGNVVVVPVSDIFSVTARNALGETCMSTPAIAQGTIFFRTRTKLIAAAQQQAADK